MCEAILVLGFGGLVFWFFYQLARADSPSSQLMLSHHIRYDSTLGLVDDPDDEWIEWAIMDDLDGEG